MNKEKLTLKDLDVLTNKILELNKNLNKKKESYKIELLESIGDNKIKIFYVYDCYENNIPSLNHHTDIIELENLYEKIENKLYNQSLFKLKTKEIDNFEEDSINFQVDVILHDECVYFQIEDTKLQSYIRICDWAIDENNSIDT